jgi:GT2 family glycosyltransferase
MTDHIAEAPSKVIIIVLTWNGREDTLACLKSLRGVDYPNWEVLVVDNGSEDGTVDAIHRDHPWVTVIETGRNLGFTGGNNVGIEAALHRGANFLLLLNNDTIVDSNLLRAFVQTAQEHPDAGVFGAKIYYFSDPRRLWFAGARWDPTTVLSFQSVGEGMLDDGGAFDEVQDSVYANGCAMFFRASVVKAVGTLDDRFFILFEEVDWCFRARRAGFRCLFVPGAKVWHKISTTFGGERSIVYEYFEFRNRLLWAERNLALRWQIRVWGQALRLLCPLPSEVGGVVWKFLRGRRDVKRAYWEARAETGQWLNDLRSPRRRMVRSAQWRALCDYLIRRFGNCPTSIRTAASRAKRVVGA